MPHQHGKQAGCYAVPYPLMQVQYTGLLIPQDPLAQHHVCLPFKDRLKQRPCVCRIVTAIPVHEHHDPCTGRQDFKGTYASTTIPSSWLTDYQGAMTGSNIPGLIGGSIVHNQDCVKLAFRNFSQNSAYRFLLIQCRNHQYSVHQKNSARSGYQCQPLRAHIKRNKPSCCNRGVLDIISQILHLVKV